MQTLAVVAQVLNSCGSRALEHRLNNCGAHQLPLGMWDLPDQGLKPCLLPWQADSLPLSHQGSPGMFSTPLIANFFFLIFFFLIIFYLIFSF